ncbi:hypothetical protein LY78DRAFT_726577 [Colletotrichum sublineola]|nr:hypothetical protein LY78DRAFT_726577 [Colletotrichum sublineola]
MDPPLPSATPETSTESAKGFTIMTPFLARSTHDLLINIIYSKLLGETTATDDTIAKLVGCNPRTVRQIRSKLLLFRSAKAQRILPAAPNPSLLPC